MNKKISIVKYITDYNRKTNGQYNTQTIYFYIVWKDRQRTCTGCKYEKINIEITEAIPAPKYAVKLNKRAYMKLINTYLTYFIIIIISPFDEI